MSHVPSGPLLSLTRVAVIAHRGGSKLRPENTLAAFDHAVSLGVDGLECDVHLSRDGEPVVIHDPTLDRTTNVTGPVGGLSAAELSDVDAGSQFGAPAGYPFRDRGHGVPRLASLLERYPSMPIVIEIKGDRPEVALRALAVAREAGALDRVILGGFSTAVLDAVRHEAPDVPTSASWDEAAFVIGQGEDWRPAGTPPFRLFQVPFRLHGEQRFDRRLVHAARRASLPVQAWIIDEADDMRMLIEWGVTGLISDRPDTALQVIGDVAMGDRAKD